MPCKAVPEHPAPLRMPCKAVPEHPAPLRMPCKAVPKHPAPLRMPCKAVIERPAPLCMSCNGAPDRGTPQKHPIRGRNRTPTPSRSPFQEEAHVSWSREIGNFPPSASSLPVSPFVFLPPHTSTRRTLEWHWASIPSIASMPSMPLDGRDGLYGRYGRDGLFRPIGRGRRLLNGAHSFGGATSRVVAPFVSLRRRRASFSI